MVSFAVDTLHFSCVTFCGGVFIVATLPTSLLLLALHGSMSKTMASETLVYVEMWCVPLCFEPHPVNEEAELDAFICCFFVLSEHDEGFVGRGFVFLLTMERCDSCYFDTLLGVLGFPFLNRTVIFAVEVNGFIWDTMDDNAILWFMR